MMKKNTIIFFFLASIATATFAQTKEDRNGNLIGYLEKSDFLQGKFKAPFEKNYDDYQPNLKVVKKIKKQLKGISVKTFFGTWCHDSEREIPRFFKIMESAEFDVKNNFKIIGLTRGKKTPDNLQKGYTIKHTPTFIFYKDGEEIGRYVEQPRETMEKDILRILKGKRYKHTYQK